MRPLCAGRRKEVGRLLRRSAGAALASVVVFATLAGAASPSRPVSRPEEREQLAQEPSAQEQTPQEQRTAGEAIPPVYQLRLQECVERALSNNLDIALSRLTPEIAATQVTTEEAVFDSAFRFQTFANQVRDPASSTLAGADILTDRTRSLDMSFVDPLRIGGTYKLVLRNLRTETNSAFQPISPFFNSEWQLAYVQPLLRNFGLETNKTRLTVARSNQQISQSDFRQAVIDTLAAVEKAYWDLTFRILDLDVNKQSLELAQNLLRLNRTKVQVGTLAPIEITQAEAGVADREEGVIVAQNEIRKAEDQLKKLLGPPSDPIWLYAIQPVDEAPFDESLPDLEQSLALAMASRPDLEKARLTVRNREAQFRFANNQRLMDLSLDASYGAKGGTQFRCEDASGHTIPVFLPSDCVTAGGTPIALQTTVEESLRQARDRDADSWRLGLTLNVPVGNRDARSRYIAARLAREQSEIGLKILEQTATVEVRQAVRQIETDIKRVKVARVNSRLQKEKLDAEQKKFENGISTSFNVLTFQQDLAKARSRENLALVDYNKSRVELERVLGTLPQARSITVRP